jgi:hypothetical protein
VLTLGETMALGRLVSKWGREKRVPWAVWRRRAARDAFYMADKEELRRQRVVDGEETTDHYGF